MSPNPIRTLLIANRGEIAVRVMRTARAMGIRTVAVHSDPDARALHVREADVAVGLGGTTGAESYLRIDRIIAAAKAAGADAIHPGYGFLSENAQFAEACAEAGITFVGPSAEAILSMGDKITAKRIMDEAGVPTVPGWTGGENASDAEIQRAGDGVGYPLMVKAAAGGGGKGMRVVAESADLITAVASARREATAAFGDGRVFMERYIERSRHVEVQVFGDGRGGAIHLFERECSIQRRHQKVVEEAPSPAVDAALRERMGAAAVAAATAINYGGAGTVEFMLSADGSFYFLEMNTRLQVEHPVTECITGLDLVRMQLEVAMGEGLSVAQEDLAIHGHAVECRIYAEDASRDFMPSTGRMHVFDPPTSSGVRVDTGFTAGDDVTVHYDPMLAKLIVAAGDRAAAVAGMRAALDEFAVLGLTTNIPFLGALVDHPAFRAGDMHTGFLTEHRIDVGGADTALADVPGEVLAAAALCREGLIGGGAGGGIGGGATGQTGAAGDAAGQPAASPWTHGGQWRNA
ncbi:MAG: acetyl/propionyl/methylcrotonyl-CoA carboxylase subunit alpha [Phycisphaerales bacterium]